MSKDQTLKRTRTFLLSPIILENRKVHVADVYFRIFPLCFSFAIEMSVVCTFCNRNGPSGPKKP